jgi:hypothetical protein
LGCSLALVDTRPAAGAYHARSLGGSGAHPLMPAVAWEHMVKFGAGEGTTHSVSSHPPC